MKVSRLFFLSGALALVACGPEVQHTDAKPAAGAPPAAAASGSSYAPNSTVYLARALRLDLAHGKIILPKGAPAKVLQNKGATLVVQCNGHQAEVAMKDIAPAVMPQETAAIPIANFAAAKPPTPIDPAVAAERKAIQQDIDRATWDLTRAEAEKATLVQELDKSTRDWDESFRNGSRSNGKAPSRTGRTNKGGASDSPENVRRSKRIEELQRIIDVSNAKLRKLKIRLENVGK